MDFVQISASSWFSSGEKSEGEPWASIIADVLSRMARHAHRRRGRTHLVPRPRHVLVPVRPWSPGARGPRDAPPRPSSPG
ncbi:hypothetical protein NDU88_001615 [Pleurodeles waltl]|uniref:Uncharacterized protein n=1 Tax=Pleurodeles waltl TaxID=8319 RepID=A0AAV7T018_PLEWA|nr:hypothetical protein NDU88_001615 [Pleurodeles waltl]